MEHYLFASGAAACACLVLRASRATRNRDDRRRHTTDPPIDHIASAAVDLVDALRGQGERFAFTGRVLHYDCQSGALLEVLRGTHGVAGLYGVGTEKEKVRAGRARYPRLQLLHANATNRPPRGAFPFRDAFFDAVVVGVGTEGVRGADRKLLFPELSRLLRGGGRLIVIDVGAGSGGGSEGEGGGGCGGGVGSRDEDGGGSGERAGGSVGDGEGGSGQGGGVGEEMVEPEERRKPRRPPRRSRGLPASWRPILDALFREQHSKEQKAEEKAASGFTPLDMPLEVLTVRRGDSSADSLGAPLKEEEGRRKKERGRRTDSIDSLGVFEANPAHDCVTGEEGKPRPTPEGRRGRDRGEEGGR